MTGVRSGPADGLEIRELSVQAWRDILRLFGSNGACAGCWCMYWRLARGERYEDWKGECARCRFRRLIVEDRAHGLLAYAGDEPVGWCAFERRIDLARLERAPSLAIDDAEPVWSLPCFFVKAGWCGRGIAGHRRGLSDAAAPRGPNAGAVGVHWAADDVCRGRLRPRQHARARQAALPQASAAQ
jgi:hypothetical protein